MAYTNSKLVSKTILSPNKYNGRASIIGITPHCYVGKPSMDGAANWLCNPASNASANYYIDPEGNILLLVEEKNTAWTSSSKINDQNRITIECASDTVAPYAFPAKTYEALIKLTADIYYRNGIRTATWRDDPVNRANITAHYFYKNKACPGQWFKNKLNSGEFCNRVNKLLNEKYGVKTATTTTKPAPSNTVGFLVKIKCDELNVRAGAGTNYKINQTVKKGEVFTVVATSGNWGKLKSGAGWINISSPYCTKL